MQVAASSSSASMASEAENLVVSEAAGGGGGGERKRKKTLGRRKIEIKKIESIEARHVCFSKRRDGIYKKATELCAMTGAKVAVVAFSPTPDKPKPNTTSSATPEDRGGKPYSFGHPSVSAVVDRYRDDPTADSAFEAPLPPIAHEFDGHKDRLEEAIAAEARRRDALDAAARAAGAWTDDVVRRAKVPDLVAMIAALERVLDEANHAMRQQCAAAAATMAAAAGACEACYYDFGDAASFTADEYGGASSGSHQQQQQQAAMDAAHMGILMGGNGVNHAAHAPPPFALAPMLLPPPDLTPPAPLAFNYGSDHSHFTGYEGYAYDLADGGARGRGAAYETEGCYFGQTTTCNFFG